MQRVGLFLVAIAASLGAATVASAEPATLEQAGEHYRALRYGKAIETARAALARGDNQPKSVAKLYELMALSSASLGRKPEAQRAFARLLALNPRYELPPDASPKLKQPLDLTREERAGSLGLSTKHDSPEKAPVDRPLNLVIEIESNPLRLVRVARLVYQLPGKATSSELWSRASKGTVVISVPLQTLTPESGPLRYRLELLDEQENVLERHGTAAEPLSVTLVARQAAAPPLRTVTEPQPEPWLTSKTIAWTGGALTAALATTSVVLAVFANRADNDLTKELETFPGSPGDIEDARRKTRHLALATDILTATTVASAAGTVVWAVLAARGERSGAERLSAARVKPSLSVGLASLAFSYPFE
jgi:tetratricopeptide (TPR) repeat protein